MNVKVLIPALLLGFTLPAHAADSRLALRVSPSVAFAPANVLVRATVDVNAANRSLVIIAESDDFYRSSEVTLDGDHAPRVTLFQFKSMPGGIYEVRAVLRGELGKEIATIGTKVNIVGDREF